LVRAGEAVLGSRIALKVAATSAAVQGVPSWNITPSRSVKRHSVNASFGVQAVARSGSAVISGFRRVKLL
jgi:hypothetical protein